MHTLAESMIQSQYYFCSLRVMISSYENLTEFQRERGLYALRLASRMLIAWHNCYKLCVNITFAQVNISIVEVLTRFIVMFYDCFVISPH